MPKYVFAFSVGPVADFISGGRRSRDLWYGSRLVAEVTRKVAESVQLSLDGHLLIPSPARLKKTYVDPFSHEGPMISNRVLGYTGDVQESDVVKALETARDTAHAFLADEMTRLRSYPKLEMILDDNVFAREIDAVRAGDFLEVYGTAAPWNGDDNDMRASIQVANEALDSIKQIRSFLTSKTLPGVPKSSLDVGRDSATREVDPQKYENLAVVVEEKRLRFGIRHEERLDAIGLTRRRSYFESVIANLPRLPFPPLSRVCIEPWLAAVASGPRIQQLRGIESVLAQARTTGSLPYVATPCTSPGQDPGSLTGLFPYDTSFLFEGGLEALIRDLTRALSKRRTVQALGDTSTHHESNASPEILAKKQRAVQKVRAARKSLEELREHVAIIHRDYGTPIPYYALIEADGDGIGTLLSEASGPERSSLIVGLDRFADDVWNVVRKSAGVSLYVGGDELLAYLPLDEALTCIQKVSQLFDVGPGQVTVKGVKPTISFGVVFAHVKSDLREVRKRAHRALEQAKLERRSKNPDKACLGIFEDVRAGAPRVAVGAVDDLCAQLQKLCALHVNSEDRDKNDLDTEVIPLNQIHAWETLLETAGDDPVGSGSSNALVLARGTLRVRDGRNAPNAPDANGKATTTARLAAHLAQCSTDADLRQLIDRILIASRVEQVARQRKKNGLRPEDVT